MMGGAMLAVLAMLAGMALLGLSGWFITATALAGLQASSAVVFDVFGPSAGIRLLAIVRTGARYAERLATHDATFAALADIRVRLFRGWAGPDAANRLLRRPARLLFRMTADLDALEALYLRLLVPAFTALCAALLAALTFGLLDATLGWAMLAWLTGTGGGLAWLLFLRARRPAMLRARALEKLRAGVIDLVAGQTDLAMAGALPAQCRLLASADAQLAQADLRLMRLDSTAAAMYTMLTSVTLAASLLALAYLVQAHGLDAPLAALALLVALTALEPFAALRRGALDAGRMRLAMRRLGPRLGDDDDNAPALAAPGAEIRLAHVCAAHAGSAAPVLRDISLRIAHGETVALIGPSGAGKSTLLALLARELAPLSGTLDCPRASLFTQRTELFQDSLRDNLRLADASADDARLWQALSAAGLAQEVAALAHGLDTPLGEGGLGLSGGQLRRLALARLFLQPASLWLLDEPTEALNAGTAADVLRRLAEQGSGRTVLVATHVRREAALADRLLLMQHGAIVGEARRGTADFDAALNALRDG
jgi:ATP-binding cassette subfamily C protein CydC